MKFLNIEEFVQAFVYFSRNEFEFNSSILDNVEPSIENDSLTPIQIIDKVVKEFTKSLEVKQEFALSIMPVLQYHDEQLTFNYSRYLSHSEFIQFYADNAELQ